MPPEAARAGWRGRFDRLRGTGVGARLARGTLWSMGAAVAVRGLGLMGAMLVARLLGAEAFGQVGVVQQTVATVGTLVGLSVGTAASRFVAAGRAREPGDTGRVLGATAAWAWGAALAGAALLAAATPALADGLLGAPALRPALWAALPLLVFSVVAQAQAGALAGFEAFRPLATSQLIGGLAGLPLQWLGAWRYGVPGFVLGLAVAEALRWALGHRGLAQAMAAGGIALRRPRREHLARLLGFGVPSMIAGVLVGPVLLASLAIVGRQPGGYAEVGLFQATFHWRNVLIFVAVQAAAAVVPVLAAAHGAGDRAGLARGLRRAVGWSLAWSAALALLLAAAAPWLMRGFGAEFAPHGMLLMWLALLAPVQALNAVGGAALSAVNRPWLLVAANAVFGTGALALVSAWPSALGLVLSQGLASVPALALMAWALRREWRGR
jgi:O-antigen/teichoic acid export membrane protein